MSRWYYITLLITVGFVSLLSTARGHYTAVNYQQDNGFPGNKVYCIYQDKRGYIWMGTENGLVCFNGYAFKTYTTKDGLPDNEVFTITEDKTGKLWMTVFAKEVCYLWRGKIYNRDNDPLLYKLSFTSLPKDILFDRWGNTWVPIIGATYLISSKGESERMTCVDRDTSRPLGNISITDNGVPLFLSKESVFCYNRDHFEFIGQTPKLQEYALRSKSFRNAAIAELSWTPFERFAKKLVKEGRSIYWNQKELLTINSFQKLSPELLGIGTRRGAYLRDIKTGKIVDSFLSNHNVSACMIATDSSLWFGTLGNGLFHFSYSFIKSIPVSQPGAIQFIKAQHNGLRFITGESTLVEVQFNAQELPEMITERNMNGPDVRNVYSYISRDHYGNWIVCDPDLSKYSKLGSRRIQYYDGHCKAVFEEGDTSLLIGTAIDIYRINKDKFTITDILYHNDRVTSLAKIDNTVYAGTLTGLIVIYPDKKPIYLLKRHPLLNGHITALCSDDNKLLWVANSKAVLTGIYDKKVIVTINEDKGLICNSISALIADSNFLWVGTDKGLFVFNRKPPFNIIRRLSAANGLASNQITYMDIADGRAYVGTDKGLNYFETSEISPLISKPVFLISNIQDGEKTVALGDVINLRNKTLKINFDVIDHSGITRPKYAYRLKDGDWTNIENNELYFPTVPYGNFTVQIKAWSPNWNTPKLTTLRFSHAAPFYRSNWFILLSGILLGGMIGILVWLLTRRMRKKEQEQLQVQKNLLQLEQMALQGQMNPHFIFNCITAIRQYYNKGNTEKANKFVDDFSNLIRTTFEMATQTFTPLEKELAYLRQYLEIEKERFSHSFDFSISKKIQSPDESIFVPTMLLQPFVENAVRHGVRHLPDGQGKIEISVVQEHENIVITVRDNGIGRLRTLQMKQTQFSTAPVTSTKVNKKRIDILNKLFDEKVTLKTSDVLNDKGEVAGTIVVISYPSDIYGSR